MHTDLSPHLHSEECNVLIKKYLDCRSDHPLLRFVGYCTDYDTYMRKCLKAERIQRQKANAEDSKKKHAAIRARIKAQENSNSY